MVRIMGEEKQGDNDPMISRGNAFQSIDSIVLQAEKELLSPDQFYRFCKKASRFLGQKKLYFYQPEPTLWDLDKGIASPEILIFFDYLATYIRKNKYTQKIIIFYLKKECPINKKKSKLLIEETGSEETHLKITIKIVGEGMIGRVAKVKINDQDVAFKTFFDPDFVWQHGSWAETPIGIYLKAHQVTKNIAEFQFAGQDWTVWEWIDPETKSEQRKGITYEQLAKKEGLTKLNNLNKNNYSMHNIRLDPGGIQKEYLGRRLDNLWRAIVFYLRKARREGVFSLMIYLEKDNIVYILKRLIALIFPKLYQGTRTKSLENIHSKCKLEEKDLTPL